MSKILISYATVHGSTAEVAEFIGQVLAEHHFNVTVLPIENVSSVAEYDAVILGSPIHTGMWLMPMTRFLNRFEGELARKPFYFFMTCIRVLEPDGYQHAREHYVHHDTLAQIGVRNIGIFAGKLRWDSINLRDRWTLSLRYDGAAGPSSHSDDFRDWTVIRAWAESVREGLEPQQHE